jgi:hypothetical protein
MSAKVFDVPELLEHIILSLPEYDILTSAQRVSRAWKASVDASPGIQRKLLRRRVDERVASPIRFLQNEPGEDWIQEMPIYQRTVKFNPLLEAARSLYPGCSMDSGNPQTSGTSAMTSMWAMMRTETRRSRIALIDRGEACRFAILRSPWCSCKAKSCHTAFLVHRTTRWSIGFSQPYSTETESRWAWCLTRLPPYCATTPTAGSGVSE